MEEDQDFEIYAPFIKPRFERVSNSLKRKSLSAGRFELKRGGNKKIYAKIFSKLTDNLEKIVGSSYVFSGFGVIPENWISLLDFLKKEGIISKIVAGYFYCDTPKFIGFSVKSKEKMEVRNSFGKIIEKGVNSFGASLNDVELALSKAVGEALERVCLSSEDENKTKKFSISQIKKKKIPFLNPLNVAGYSNEQKNSHSKLSFDEETTFCWSEGESLFSRHKVLLPSQLVFWNYSTEIQGEPFIREPNTNGAGGHFTSTEAIISGIYELVQRDGFLIYWLNCISPRVIDISSLRSGELLELIEQCCNMNFEVFFLDITTDIEIPNCACVLIDNSGIGPKAIVGLGCGMEWEDIMKSAFLEALGIYTTVRSKINDKKSSGEKIMELDEKYIPFSDKKIGQYDRLEIWAQEKMFDKFIFFIQGKEIKLSELIEKQKKFISPEEELDYLIKKFKAKGKDYEIFHYQVKKRILDDVGYCVARVIVPALMPIYLNEINITFGCSRLMDVPPRIGFKTLEKINPWPHPFV